MRRVLLSRAVPRLVLGLAALVGLVLVPASDAQAPQPGRDLLAQARRAWADYEAVARHWSFRVRRDWTDTDGNRGRRSTVDEILVRGNGRCIALERSDPLPRSGKSETMPWVCKVVASEYEFEARRSHRGAGWALTSVLENADAQKAVARGDLPADRWTMRDEIESGSLLIAVAVDQLLASRLMGHACCRTERFAPVSAEAGAAVEWRFTVDDAKVPYKVHRMKSGRVLFDPSQRWVIRESRTDTVNGVGGITTISRKRTYKAGPGGYPVPDEVHIEYVSDDKSYTAKGLDRFELLPPKTPLQDKDFTLTAYGIPEAARSLKTFGVLTGQPGRQTQGAPWAIGWYWPLLLVGVALIGVAVVIRIVRARRRTADAAN
jgi:hypothetical protein